jgi:predicted HTH domain antitoxin
MRTLLLNTPDTVDINEQEAKMILAARLYVKGFLSMGQAAELAGYTKRVFMELLADYNVSLFNYSESDLESDILNAQAYGATPGKHSEPL